MRSPRQIASSDLALVQALARWGSGETVRLLAQFSDRWVKRLIDAKIALGDPVPGIELETIALAQAKPDLSPVHPSWFVRALKDESESVRRAVIRSIDEPIRSILIREFQIAPTDLKADRPADPEVLRVALSAWTEQLVGDRPTRKDDPEAIRALTTYVPAVVYRLAKLCGQAKLATIKDLDSWGSRPRLVSRISDFQGGLGGPSDSRLLRLAEKDWSGCRPHPARLGLLTIGRCLARADAHRLRWALQHMPYSVAKRIRIAAGAPEASIPSVSSWEADIFRVAEARLRTEDRIVTRGDDRR